MPVTTGDSSNFLPEVTKLDRNSPADGVVFDAIHQQLVDNDAFLNSKKADVVYVDTLVASVASGSPKGTYASLADLQAAFPDGNTNIYLVTGDVKEVDTLNVTNSPTSSGNITVSLNGVATNISVTSGVQEVSSLTITGVPTTAGYIGVTLNGAGPTIPIDPAVENTTDLVAAKIRGTTFTGYTTGGTGPVVTFTANAVGWNSDITYVSGGTGATGTASVTTQGVDADTPTSVATKIRNTAFSGWTTSGTGTTVIFTNNTSGAVSAPVFSSGTTGTIATFGITVAGWPIDGKWYYWNTSAWTAGGTYQSTGIADYGITLPKLEANIQSKIFKATQLVDSSHRMTNGITGTTIDDANTAHFTSNTTYGNLGFSVPNTLGNKYISVMTVTNIGTIAAGLQRMVTYNNSPSSSALVSKNGIQIGNQTLAAGQVATFVDKFVSAESAYTAIALGVLAPTIGAILKVSQKVYNVTNLTDQTIGIIDWTNIPPYIMFSEITNLSQDSLHAASADTATTVSDGAITLSKLEPSIQSKIFKGASATTSSKYMYNGINASNVIIDDPITLEFITNTTYGTVGLTVPNINGNKYKSVMTITNLGSTLAALNRMVTYNYSPNSVAGVTENGSTIGGSTNLGAGQSVTFKDDFTSSKAYTAVTLSIFSMTNGANLKISQKIYNVTYLTDDQIAAIDWVNLPANVIIADVATRAINSNTSDQATHAASADTATTVSDGAITLSKLEPSIQSKIFKELQLVVSNHYMYNGINSGSVGIDDTSTAHFTTTTAYGNLGFSVPNTLGKKYISVMTVTNTGLIDASGISRMTTYNNSPSSVSTVAKNGILKGSSSLAAGQTTVFVDEFVSAESAYTAISLGIFTTTNGATLKISQKVFDVTSLSDDVINAIDWQSQASYVLIADVAKNSLNAENANHASTADSLLAPSKWYGKTWITLGDSFTSPGTYQSIVQAALGFGTVLNKGIAGQGVRTMMDNVTLAEAQSADLITLYGCANDFYPGAAPIGSITDTPNKDGSTFISKLKYTIEQVFTYKPTARLVIIGTHNIADSYRPPIYQPVNGTDDVGNYVKAMGDVARHYGCPFIDLYAKSGFNSFNLLTYSSDGAHPNTAGYNEIAKILIGELKKIEPLS